MVLTPHTRRIGRDGHAAYTPLRAANDMQRVRDLYLRAGFLGAEVTYETDYLSDTVVALSISIREGEQTFCEDVRISGIENDQEEALLPSPPWDIFHIDTVRAFRETLLEEYREKGYPFVDVGYRLHFNEDSSSVSVEYLLDPGDSVRVQGIHFSGNLKTNEAFLRRILSIEEGDVFSRRELSRGVRRLRTIRSFSSLTYSIVALEEGYEEVDIIFSLTESRPYSAEVGLAYDTYNSFNVSLRAQNRNFLQRDRHLGVRGMVTAQREGEVELTFANPHFLYREIRATSSLYGTYGLQGSVENYAEIGNIYSLHWRMSEAIQATASLSFEARDIRNTEAVRNAAQISTILSYDSRDSFLRPRRGSFFRGEGELSYGFSYEVDNFVRARGEFRTYVTPVSAFTFAGRFGGGVVHNYTPALDTIQRDQLLTLGGVSSVRGYEEGMLFFESSHEDESVEHAPLGGYAALFGNIEARIPLILSFEANTFFDVGLLTDQSDYTFSETPRGAYGGGVRYVSPLGAIGVVYAQKASFGFDDEVAKQYYEENPDMWIFSINYTF
ncbi:BamA/OMP85 family outer membrane protein [Chitinivibrio alkaliphilus]|uniref:Outer membrane protein/protective antigen OMA87 n=1 Tax=Chitinivibrio alkaliphilus ACht1 TaxID=1313304 RepID=U7DA66_9BACT|nr:BamA/TamA family outer membrane protein [Chitinivibrio alkaliphilus]ERP32017.1 Outer membrane protein/protective antigen OMA87 [Chitinivibrio alkaliphilus ACht1]